ncbi:50S ribosomal protein L5 [bacterium]|nr:50S ribosomal protein L5 [bacterium]
MAAPLKTHYKEKIAPELQKELGIANVHQIPALSKVVINVGVGEATSNKGVVDKVVSDITLIAGQKPVVALARKSVSAFKLRKGLAIGVKVTLRGDAMYYFLEKLFKVVLPRIRDFRGIPETSFDGRGNLNIGITDQTLFPEIDYDKIDKIRGLDITIVTTAQNDQAAQSLCEKLGLVFIKKA